MSEFFDIYDEALRHIGVKRRDDVHRDGDWHQVFHCWVIGREANGDPFLILQKRSRRTWIIRARLTSARPGIWQAGETARDGLRET